VGGFAKTALIKSVHVFTAQKRLEVARPGSLALAQHKPTLRSMASLTVRHGRPADSNDTVVSRCHFPEAVEGPAT